MLPLLASSQILGLPAWLVVTYLVVAGVAAIALMVVVLGGRDNSLGTPSGGDDPITGILYAILFAPFALAGMLWPLWLPWLAWKWWRASKRPAVIPRKPKVTPGRKAKQAAPADPDQAILERAV